LLGVVFILYRPQLATQRTRNKADNMNQIPVTVKGAELLKAELQRLRSVDRPAVIEAIAEARAQGDLSENAEYEAAKEKQSFIEGRLAEIEAKLSNAMVIDPKTLNAEGRCVFGATIDVEDLDTGDTATYQIVGDDEADIKSGKISISSPISRALIGKSAGDVAEVVAPNGIRSYEVLNVQYI
jgi:transcription elongation factor GreA